MKEYGAGHNGKQVFKELAEKWKVVSKEEKEIYNKMAEEDRDRFHKESNT